MASLNRWITHSWMDAADAKRLITPAGLARIEQAVTQSESRHRGELRLCVEGGLGTAALWHGLHARTRAINLFSALRVWDTEHNNGVLIYLLLADRRIEILADRGLNARVPDQAWSDIAERLSRTLQGEQYETGLLQAIDSVGALLREHFPLPRGEHRPNELPNAVVLI